MSTATLALPEQHIAVGTQSANLDLLRSFAVITVLVAHFGDAFRTRSLIAVGQVGVLFFFVHTALVLLQSLSRMHADGIGRVTSRFFIQRAFRICPLYFAAIAFTLLLRVPAIDALGEHAAAPWLGWKWVAANMLLLQNVLFVPQVSTPMWSLPYEMQMYLALPAIYLVTLRKEALTKLWLLAFFAGTSALAMLLFVPWPFDGQHQPVTYFVPCFMAGAYAFVLSRKKAFLPAYLLPVMLMAAVALFWWRPTWPAIQWLIPTFIGLVLHTFVEVQSRAIKAVCHSIAKYSYGIYLWNWPLVWVWFRRVPDLSTGVRVVAFLCSLALLSVASYHLLEAPCIRLGRTIVR